MHCLLILLLICSYMWDLTSKTHIWCIHDFILKIGCYSHAGHVDTIVFSKLQFISNSATTSLSNSADTSLVF